ncbi:hypothetical protein OF846_002202 [Rhodotorula toruloides]|nr:hypothetical protein OF846_002202 [Rhodotorula toruloides]
MSPQLEEVVQLLNDFPDEQTALAQAMRVEGSLPGPEDGIWATSTQQKLLSESLERLTLLATPPAYLGDDDEDLDAAATLAKERFLRNVRSLSQLAQSLSRRLTQPSEPVARDELDLRVRLILSFGRFTGQSEVAEEASSAALCDGLLSRPYFIRLPLLRHILSVSLPPFFKPHPNLNPSTGRVLSRPLGGDSGIQHWYEESEDDATSWRRQPGLGAVVELVINALQPGEIEDLWPLLLPPLLAYLDEYDAKNKLVGLSLLDALLAKVDASLLRRTGVGKVFEKSLDLCFSSLSDPLTPTLLERAHPVALKLLNLQYPHFNPSRPAEKDDSARFTALCSLLASSIIKAWEFKAGNVEVESVSCRALPPLLDALGSGTIRYLQILVPHFADLLATTATAGGGGTWTLETIALMTEASKALLSVIANGKLRIKRWEGRIGGAVAQCWVGVNESPAAKKLRSGTAGANSMQELEEGLQKVMAVLGEATGSEKAIAERLERLDPSFDRIVRPTVGLVQ